MKLSIIIPVYNEADIIAETVDEVKKRAGKSVLEIIIVDGGSSDATVEKAESTGAKVISSPKKGRAAQMNYGAEQAKGDILYFLHADSIPPVDFDRKITRAVSAGFKSGCFQLAFDKNHPLLDFYAWFTRFDIDAFRFGDQSLFILRNVFFTIKGFREDHIVMEDNEIVRRIKKKYSFTILDDAVETSARAYLEVGIIKMQIIFVMIFLLYFMGIKQETLANIKDKNFCPILSPNS